MMLAIQNYLGGTTMTTLSTRSKMLSKALRANAIFSSLGGLIFVLDASMLSDLTGIHPPLAFTLTGLGLIAFSVFLFRLRNSHPNYNPMVIWAVIIADLLWVVDSILLLVTGWLPLSLAGKWIVTILAEVVLAFAIWQYFGLRRMQK